MTSVTHTHGILFDIDDTLVDTSVACAHKLWEIEPIDGYFSPDDVLTTYGLPELVPEWKQYAEKIHTWLTDISFLAQLPEIPHAHESVHRLQTLYPITGYLTSRLPFAFETTTQWLAAHSFPQAPVIYRFPDTTDRDWKIRYMQKNLPDSIGIVDNELYVPSETTYKGKMIELIRFRLMSPFDPRKIICHSWDAVWREFASPPEK